MSAQTVKVIVLWLNTMHYDLDYPWVDYLVCGLSAHDRKLLMTKYEGGKWRDLAPRARIKSSTEQFESFVPIHVFSAISQLLCVSYVLVMNDFWLPPRYKWDLCFFWGGGFYAAQKGSFLPTFRDNLSVPSSKVQQSNKASWNILRYVHPKRGQILCTCYVYSK